MPNLDKHRFKNNIKAFTELYMATIHHVASEDKTWGHRCDYY